MQRVADLARSVSILSVWYIMEYIKNKSKNIKQNNKKGYKINKPRAELVNKT
jgi:hypothetical protein